MTFRPQLAKETCIPIYAAPEKMHDRICDWSFISGFDAAIARRFVQGGT